MAVVEVLNRETGEFTFEEQDMEPVELGGATPLQQALSDFVRSEFVRVNEVWSPSIDNALKMTRDNTSSAIKTLLNEAMQDLNEAVKPKQMTLVIPAARRSETRS